jgi:hypothetical protein
MAAPACSVYRATPGEESLLIAPSIVRSAPTAMPIELLLSLFYLTE